MTLLFLIHLLFAYEWKLKFVFYNVMFEEVNYLTLFDARGLVQQVHQLAVQL